MHRTGTHDPIVYENLPTVKRKTRRRIRGLLLLGTVVVIAIFGVAAYFWHAYRTDRNADSFLQRAKVLEKENRWLEAAEYYRLYLQLRTRDVRAEIGLAKAYDKWAAEPASKAQAAEYYRRAVAALQCTRKPGSRDRGEQLVSAEEERTLRRRMVELLLEVRDFTAALEQFIPGRLDKAKDPRAARLYALTLYERFRWDPAAAKRAAARLDSNAGAVADELEQALKRNPGDVRLSVTLAKAYRDQPELLSDQWRIKSGAERAGRANAIMEEMLSEDTQTPDGLLAHYDYQVRYGLAPGEDDLRKALQLDPESVVVRLKMAEHALRESRRVANAGGPSEKVKEHRTRARRHYEKIIGELDSLNERAYLGLGRVYLIEGDAQRARRIWELGLEQGNKNSILLNSVLAEFLIARNELKDAEKFLSQLERAIIQLKPKLSRSARQSLASSRDFLEARWLVKQGKHARAMSLLQQVTLVEPITTADTTQRFQSLLLLGATHISLQQWAQAATTYEQAAQLDTKAVEPYLAAARAWRAADQFTNAIACLRKAVALEHGAEAPTLLALALLQRESRLPKQKRDWEPFEEAFAHAKQASKRGTLREPWRLMLLEADYLLVRGEESKRRDDGIEDARQVLRRAESTYSGRLGLLRQLVSAYERLGSHDDADRVLKQLTEISDTPVANCLLRSRLLCSRKKYDEARKELSAVLETASAESQTAVKSELVQVCLLQGDVKECRARLEALHDEHPSNQRFLRRLLELALNARDYKDAKKWEDRLRVLEGPPGLYSSYCEARRLLAQISDPHGPEIARAAALQKRIQHRLPAWPGIYLLEGTLRERQGKPEEAVQAYAKAISLGEQRFSVYESLILLLSRLGRRDEANTLLSKLQYYAPPSERLTTLGISVAVAQNELEHALTLAAEGVKQRPGDPSAYLRRGRLLLANNQVPEAETSFLKTVALAPEGAHATDARLRLAQIYEAQGKIAKAQQQYTPLVQCENPKSTHLAMHITLLLRADLLDQAGAYLDKFDAVAPESLGAMQLRARLLRAQNRPLQIGPLVEGFAKKLLARAGDDRRTKAAVYLTVGNVYSNVTLHKAAEVWYRRLAEVAPRRFGLLGMSLARQGRIKEAVRLCTESAESEGLLRPAIILAAALQTTQPTKEDLQFADTFLVKAVQQHSDHAGLLVAIAGVRVVQSRFDDAVELYEKALRNDPQHLAALNNLATLLSEQAGERERALEYVDRAIKIAGRRPALLDTKGMILLHQGQVGESLPLLQQAALYHRADPRFSFHLAVAYYRAGAFDKAHTALQRAYDHKLTTQLLTQADRALLAELEGTLQQQSYSRTLSDPHES